MPGLTPRDLTAAEINPYSLPQAPVAGLYVHIPFCFHKCHYCDFYSITRQSSQRMSRFVELLICETEMWTALQAPAILRPQTIFFGGGTPTLLPLAEMCRLIRGLKRRLDLSCVKEWTIEANPATVSESYCRMLREEGVNRISFGAQSFDRTELGILERHHDPTDVAGSIAVARACGFERINVDLIYAIPGQNLESWSKSLEAAIALNTPHVSCYGLTYEPNTPLSVRKRLGQIRAVDEQLELDMFYHARARLSEAGLQPYEISNYARVDEACLHNLVYWTGGNYLGLGPSAASHIDGHRFRNRPHLGEWEQAVQRGELAATDYEKLSPRQRAGELAMLMLRLSRPVNFNEFADKTGFDPRVEFHTILRRLSNLGLLVVDSDGMSLSQRGLAVADAVAAEFLQDVP